MRGLRRTIGSLIIVSLIYCIILLGHALYQAIQENKYVNECSSAVELAGLDFLFDDIDQECRIEYKNNNSYTLDRQYEFYKNFNSLSNEELQTLQNEFITRLSNQVYFSLHKDEIITTLESLYSALSDTDNNTASDIHTSESTNNESDTSDTDTDEYFNYFINEYSDTSPTAQCVDGTYSYSQNRQGTCSHHNGVAIWY